MITPSSIFGRTRPLLLVREDYAIRPTGLSRFVGKHRGEVVCCLRQRLPEGIHAKAARHRRLPMPPRHGIEQLPRVRVLRIGIDARRRAVFDDFAVAHHRDAVAHLRRDAQVMRDEQHREIEAVADIGEQPQHLRLNRHVER